MIPISQNINTLYSALLIQKAVPEKYHPYYRKWLRYYLDFSKNTVLYNQTQKACRIL